MNDYITKIDGVRYPEFGEVITDRSGHSYKVGDTRKANTVANVKHIEYECVCISGPKHVGETRWFKLKWLQEYIK